MGADAPSVGPVA